MLHQYYQSEAVLRHASHFGSIVDSMYSVQVWCVVDRYTEYHVSHTVYVCMRWGNDAGCQVCNAPATAVFVAATLCHDAAMVPRYAM